MFKPYLLLLMSCLPVIGFAACQDSNAFCGHYFDNPGLSGNSVLQQDEININHNWDNAGPVANLNDQFSARWTKTISIPQTANYRFTIVGDDGVRVYLDNQLIINGWQDQAATEYQTQIEVAQGEHQLVIEYYEAWGKASVSFNYQALDTPTPDADVASFWLGHSLIGHDIPFLVGEIAASLGKSYTRQYQITNGAPLKCNWQNCGTLQGVNARDYLPGSNINTFVMTEAVPLQNHLDWSQTYEYAQLYYELAQQSQTGAEVYLYETWHCITSGTDIECPWDGNTHIPWRERLTQDLSKWQGIIAAVKQNHPNARLQLVPAGQAMAAMHDAIANGEIPGFSSIDQLFSDDIHLNDLGAYYISLVHFATLYRQSPQRAVHQNIYNPERWYTYQAPTLAQAQKMQALAWQVVSAFYPPTSSKALGINITKPSYWSTEWMFVDLVKRAGNGKGQMWVTLCDGCNGQWWDTEEQDALELDPAGWPLSLPSPSDPNHDFFAVGTILLSNMEGKYPAGDYIVLFDGEGELSFQWDGEIDHSQTTPGRMVLTVTTPDHGIFMRINATNPDNPIRNIRVIMPGGICGDITHYALDPQACNEDYQSLESLHQSLWFHPLFLQRLSPFASIRFMQYLDTVTSQITQWQNRATPSLASWAQDHGAPLEGALALANTLNLAPWLHLPARVDDEYAIEFARLIKHMLNPNLDFYLEYYNEVWNSAWPFGINGAWIQAQGEAQWTDPNQHWYQKKINWYGKRSAELCALVKQEFGVQADRVKCVMGGFAANDWTTRQALNCPLAVADGLSACHQQMHGFAIGPYFGGYLQDNDLHSGILNWLAEPDGGLSKLFNELEFGELYDDDLGGEQAAPQGGALKQAQDFIASHQDITLSTNLKMLAYEGGQHLSMNGDLNGDRALINPLFLNANRDNRMGELSKKYLDKWQALDGDLFMWFESTGGYGRWGAFPVLEYQDQPLEEAHKYRALIEWQSQ